MKTKQWNVRQKTWKEKFRPTSEFIANATADFLKAGGKIAKIFDEDIHNRGLKGLDVKYRKKIKEPDENLMEEW